MSVILCENFYIGHCKYENKSQQIFLDKIKKLNISKSITCDVTVNDTAHFFKVLENNDDVTYLSDIDE